jgi:hypothetical protein
MNPCQITDTAVLVGTSPEGTCVYSALLPLGEYWDGEHPWDDSERVKSLRLSRLQGLLFGQEGELVQQFESNFNSDSGVFQSGWARHADGTVQSL